MDIVGKLSMLMDSEGVIQVKVNDGLFETYEPLEFGYGEVDIGGSPQVRIPDLSGRWAFSDNESYFTATTPPPTSILPLVFDVTSRTNVPPPPPVITPPPTERVWYSIRDIEGEPVAEMLCEYRDEMVRDLKSPTVDNFVDWYEVRMLSIERMKMTNTTSPDTGVGIGTGTAVRID